MMIMLMLLVMAGLATKRTVVEAMTAADNGDGDTDDENDDDAFGSQAYQDADDEHDDLDDSHDHEWQNKLYPKPPREKT